MTGFLLDTNILSDLVRHPDGIAATRIREVGEENICTSIIVAAELRFGAAKSGSARLIERVDTILGVLDVRPFQAPAEERYADIRARLEKAGTPIGANDMLIAAHALALGSAMVTANLDEFERVEGLKVENWLRP